MFQLSAAPIRTAFRLSLALVLVVVCRYALAGTGMVVRTPPPNIRNTTGIELEIDTQWVDASGYRVVRVHVSTATGAASPTDREVTVELSPSNYGMDEGDFTARQTIVLPAGVATVSEQMLVPQNEPWHEISTRVDLDGNRSELLSTRVNVNSTTGNEWSEAVPAILVIDDDAPRLLDRYAQLIRFNRNSRAFEPQKKLYNVRALEMLVNRNRYNGGGYPQPRDMETLRRVANTPRLELIPPADMPERWIGLSCFDLVIISHDNLTAMSSEHPTQFSALTDWTATGGNLLVFGLGNNYQQLNSAEALLSIAPRTKGDNFESAGWMLAERRHYNNAALRTYENLEGYGQWYGTDEGEEPVENLPVHVDKAFGTTNSPKFLKRPLGLGLVVAMATDDPFSNSTSTEWSWVMNSVGESRTMWYRRHGLSLRRKNNEYWDFLVPNTGKAPVFVFCALITLFAVIIGPVNYFILARQRRLYMLLITIPGGAAIVTLCLILYAIVADGLGTQVRVRSYTLLDQTTGRAVDWSRQSYYSGMAPSRGMTFPTDTAVYTVEQFPHHEDDHGFRRKKRLEWTQEQGQNLRKGYLTSRVTSQFITLRTANSTAGVKLDQRDSPQSVRNQLGSDIELILVCDSQGKLFVATEVPAEEKGSLEPADVVDVRTQFQRIFAESRPGRPQGLDPDQFEDWNMRRWYGWNMIDNGLADPRLATGRMEDRLRWVQNVQPKDIPKATYIAVVKSGPETPLGVRSRESKGSLHVVEGKF